MAKRTGFSQAVHCWCSPVWLGDFCIIFTNKKIWAGTNNKNFPAAQWTLRNVQSLQTGFMDFALCARERRTLLLQKGNASDTWQGHTVRLCQRESLPQLHFWCSSLHPVWDKTLLPPWTGTSVSPASTFLILLKHNLVPLLIKPTKVAAAGSILRHSQHCPFWPYFSKT